MKNKKALMYEFLIRLIIALVLVTSAIWIGKSFFRLTDSGLESYNKLVEVINDIDVGELESMPIYMDKGTGLIGFTSKSTKIEEKVFGDLGGISLYNYLDRSIYCERDEACLCICRDGWENVGTITQNGNDWNYKCDEYICNSFGHIDFVSPIKSEDFTAKLHHEAEFIEINSSYEFTEGFVFSRRESNMDSIYFPSTFDRVSTLYIERQGDEVYVCLKDPPCFPE